MPKISGKEIISESTEKSVNKLILFSAAAILAKAYGVPMSDMKALNVDIPAPVFDVTLLVLVAYFMYIALMKWTVDLIAFRLWFSESSIWSNFGTNMKLDKTFINGGIDLLKRLHELEKANRFPETLKNLDETTKRQYDDFKANVELYSARLQHAGTKFSTVSLFGHFYIWFQNFILPVGLAVAAIYLLIKYGQFAPPTHL